MSTATPGANPDKKKIIIAVVVIVAGLAAILAGTTMMVGKSTHVKSLTQWQAAPNNSAVAVDLMGVTTDGSGNQTLCLNVTYDNREGSERISVDNAPTWRLVHGDEEQEVTPSTREGWTEDTVLVVEPGQLGRVQLCVPNPGEGAYGVYHVNNPDVRWVFNVIPEPSS